MMSPVMFTMADLQNLMKKVVYVNNSEKPSSDSREILFSVSDDENVSSTVTQKSILITAVNDKPSN